MPLLTNTSPVQPILEERQPRQQLALEYYHAEEPVPKKKTPQSQMADARKRAKRKNTEPEKLVPSIHEA